MEFPETFEQFAKEYGFKDSKEVYTNGSDLIPIFRVKQWLEHDNKLRRIETDTAYECGKHANKWIPVSEKLPEKNIACLVSVGKLYLTQIAIYSDLMGTIDHRIFYQGDVGYDNFKDITQYVTAWMPLPKPYKPRESEE